MTKEQQIYKYLKENNVTVNELKRMIRFVEMFEHDECGCWFLKDEYLPVYLKEQEEKEKQEIKKLKN